MLIVMNGIRILERMRSHFSWLYITRFPFIFTDGHKGSTWLYQRNKCKAARKNVDVVEAFTKINMVKRTLHSVQSGVGQFHRRVYRSAVELAEVINVDESVPRTTGRQ